MDHFRIKGFLTVFFNIDIASSELSEKCMPKHELEVLFFLAMQFHCEGSLQKMRHLLSHQLFQWKGL